MAPPKTLPAPLEEIHAVLLQANAGDTQALVTVRHWLDTHPAAWQVTGDVARQVQDALLTRIAGDNAVKRECTQRAMETLSQSLAGAQPSPLEQLLAQRVVLDWLYLHYLEALELRQMEESRPMHHADYSARRVDHAHRRYLRSIKTLATVRRLLTPAMLMQFGVHAHQHLHVATPQEPA